MVLVENEIFVTSNRACTITIVANFAVPSYAPHHMTLGENVSVGAVSVSIQDQEVPRNNLLTFLEDDSVQMAAQSSISYRKLNFLRFDFRIRVNNPEAKSKRVIVRIILAQHRQTDADGFSW